jgi:hypothetical protein
VQELAHVETESTGRGSYVGIAFDADDLPAALFEPALVAPEAAADVEDAARRQPPSEDETSSAPSRPFENVSCQRGEYSLGNTAPR